MLTTIKGVFESGQVFLKEEPPVIGKTEVMVTFLAEENNISNSAERIPGGLKGKVTIPEDFNDPLEDLNEYM